MSRFERVQGEGAVDWKDRLAGVDRTTLSVSEREDWAEEWNHALIVGGLESDPDRMRLFERYRL
jgi:hypothetical protein